MSGEIEEQASEGKITHSVLRSHECSIDEFLGLAELVGKHQSAYRVKSLTGSRVVVAVGTAGPECFFVQLNLVTRNSAVYHGTHLGVSDRQSLNPGLGRLIVGEPHVAGYNRHLGGNAHKLEHLKRITLAELAIALSGEMQSIGSALTSGRRYDMARRYNLGNLGNDRIHAGTVAARFGRKHLAYKQRHILGLELQVLQ